MAKRPPPSQSRNPPGTSARKRRKEAPPPPPPRDPTFLARCLDVAEVMLVALDAGGRITVANRKASAVLGWPAEELLGRDWFDTCVPEGARARVREAFAAIMGGDPAPAEQFENPVLTRSGETRLIAWRNTLLKDDAGAIIGTLSSGQDITETRAREERVHLLSLVAEQVGDGVAVADPKGNLLWVNRAWAAMHGYEPAELVGKNLSVSHTPAQLESEVVPFNERALAQGSHHGEVGHIRRDGTPFPTKMTTTLLRGDDGAILGFLGTARDISEAKRAEEALRQSANRLRALLIAIPDMMFVLDAQGVFLDHHAPEGSLLFRSPQDFLGRPIEEILPSELCPPMRAAMAEARESGTVGLIEYTLPLQPGTRYFEARIVHQADGKFLVIVRDITEMTEAEEALRRREAEHRQVFDGISEGIYVSTADGHPVMANPALVRMLGFDSQEDLNRRDIAKEGYVFPEERERFKELIERDGRVVDFEAHWYRKDGSVITVLLNSRGVRGPDGRVALYEGLVRDITESRRAEEALRASEERFRNIVEHSTNLFYSHTPEHILTYVSPRSEAFFDCPAEEALVRWTEFVTDNPLNEAGFDSTQRAIDTGVAQPPYELELRTRKGRLLWVQVNEAPVVQEGKTVAIVGALTDITERKVAEEALREGEAKYRLLVETVQEIIYFVEVSKENPEGHIAFISPQVRDLLGYEPEALLGDPAKLLGLLHPRDRSAAMASFRTLLSGSGPESRQFRLQHRVSGEYRWVEDLGVPVRDAQGRVLGFQGVARDITDRKLAEELVRRKNLQLLSLVDSSEALGKLDFPSAAWVICEAARVAFKAKLVWIGLVTPDSTEILPIASAGDDDGYTRLIRVRWDESPRSQGPTGRCIKRRQPVTMSIYDEAFAPWRSEALRRGFQVVCALPLLHEDHVRGAITFYSEDPLGFPPDSAEVMGLFARQTVLALVNASLYQEARESVEELLRKERDLSLQTAYFRELFESSPEAVAIVDQDDHIKDINREFTRLFQWEPEEVRGRLINDVVVPDHLRDEAGTISKTVLSGEVVQAQELRRKKDGTLFPVFILGAPIRIAGERHGVLAIYRDMTDIQASVDEVRKFQFMVEGSSQEIYLIHQDGSLAYVNQAAAGSLGYTREEMLAAGVDGFDMTVGGRLREHFEENRDQGFPPFEAIHRAKDGTLRTKEIRGVIVTIGGEEFICGFGQDVTDRVRVEEAVRRSEALYRGFVENARAIVLAWDPDGTVTFWNDFAAEFFGYSREEILGKSLFDTIVPRIETTGRDLQGLLLHIGQDPDQYASNINQNRTKDGRLVWVAWANRPVLAADGRVESVVSYGTDITTLIKADQALGESERKYKALVETTHTGYVILDLEGRVLDANAEYLSLTGRGSLEDLKGRSVVEWTLPEDRDRNAAEVRRCLDGGFVEGLEVRYITPEGRVVPVEVNATVVPDAGEVRILSLVRDISERKRAEEDLASSESRMKAIVDSVPECIKLIDADGILLDMNPAGLALLGATLEQVRGLNAEQIVTPEYREAFREFTRRVCGGERGSLEFEILNLKGQHLRMSSSAAPLRLRPDGPAVCLAVTRVIGPKGAGA